MQSREESGTDGAGLRNVSTLWHKFCVDNVCILRYNVQSSFDGGPNSDCVNSPEFTVERRYSDFVLLQKELARAYPGAIIPPLPKDQMFGRFKQDFIDSRMRGLDDFISRIHNHPQLSESPCLRSFLSLATFDESAIAASQHNGTQKKTWRDDIWKFNPTLVESQVILLCACGRL